MFYEGVQDGSGTRLCLKVMPASGRLGFGEVSPQGFIKLYVRAAPERGKANEEARAFLSKFFGIAKGKVVIEKGETAQQKKVFLEGISPTDCANLFRQKALL